MIGITDHAVKRWLERSGFPVGRLVEFLTTAKPAGKRQRKRLTRRRPEDEETSEPSRYLVSREAGVVFVLVRHRGARFNRLVTVLEWPIPEVWE